MCSAQRVLRLLLAGVPPAKILCLTFTKAAAANMAASVSRLCRNGPSIDDGELAAAIEAIGAGPAGPSTLIFARRLFARTVETPGGLKIHTIHAFCERLLHLFPFEANVPARFEVLEDLGQAELLTSAKRATLQAAEIDPGALGEALRQLTGETSQRDFDMLIKEAMGKRSLFRQMPREALAASLRAALGLQPNDNVDSIEAEMIEGGIAPGHWAEFADFLARGGSTDRDREKLFRQALAAYACIVAARKTKTSSTNAPCLDAYLDIFFTKDNGPRKSLATKDIKAARPDLAAELEAEQTRLDDLARKAQIRRLLRTLDGACDPHRRGPGPL